MGIDIKVTKNLLLDQTCDNCVFNYKKNTDYCWAFRYNINRNQEWDKDIRVPEIRTCDKWTKIDVKFNLI